jgi:hypothetical protein
MSKDLLKEALENLQFAETHFNDESEEGTNLAFISLLDAVANIHAFLKEYTKKRKKRKTVK